MIKGVLFALASYAIYSCADACIKASGGRLHVAELTLIATVFSFVAVLPLKPRSERWSEMLLMRRPGIVTLRAVAGLLSSLFSVYAFTHLPLADAYSLIFLLPAFVALFSLVFLRERISGMRVLALLVGLVGVMLVVKPGFQELLPGHFAAIGTAMAGGASLLLLRVISPVERQVTLLGSILLFSLVANGIVTIFVFEMPTWREFFFLALCGLLAGLALAAMMAATRYAPASRIGPAQYSQIIWAVVFGGIFFGEVPDAIALGGIALVILSGVMNFMQARAPAALPAPVSVEPISAEAAAPRGPAS